MIYFPGGVLTFQFWEIFAMIMNPCNKSPNSPQIWRSCFWERKILVEVSALLVLAIFLLLFDQPMGLVWNVSPLNVTFYLCTGHPKITLYLENLILIYLTGQFLNSSPPCSALVVLKINVMKMKFVKDTMMMRRVTQLGLGQWCSWCSTTLLTMLSPNICFLRVADNCQCLFHFKQQFLPSISYFNWTWNKIFYILSKVLK